MQVPKNIGVSLAHHPRLFFAEAVWPNVSGNYFSRIVERSNNYVFEDDLIPRNPRWEELQVTNLPIVFVGKTIFHGGGAVFPGIIEKQSKLNKKHDESVLAESNEQH